VTLYRKNDKLHIFRPLVTICCYSYKKPSATSLVCCNSSPKCSNVLEIMAIVTYLYATHYIESNGLCFTYQRFLWATTLHSNGLSSRYIDTEL